MITNQLIFFVGLSVCDCWVCVGCVGFCVGLLGGWVCVCDWRHVWVRLVAFGVFGVFGVLDPLTTGGIELDWTRLDFGGEGFFFELRALLVCVFVWVGSSCLERFFSLPLPLFFLFFSLFFFEDDHIT